jgi:DNA-directed RNA polymerase subunit H (RpoH/RPB5)
LVSKPDFELVLEHEILSESEAKKVSKGLNTQIKKFPKIWKDDAQIVKKNPVAGQLVAIHRKDPTGKYTYYRVVVDNL